MSDITTESGAQQPQQLPRVACDRCRGQKLRCVWENGSRQCRRCARAKAICAVSPPKPIGRPARNPPHEAQQGFGGSSKDSQIMHVDGEDTPNHGGLTHAGLSEEMLFMNFTEPQGCTSSPETTFEAFDFNQMLQDSYEDSRASSISIQPTPFLNGPHNAAPVAPMMTSTALAAEINHSPGTNLQYFDQTPSFSETEDDLARVMQLCELNVALCKHRICDTKRLSLSRTNSFDLPLSADAAAGSVDASSTLALADLKLGQLLGLTSQLGDITTRLDAQVRNTTTTNPATSASSISQERAMRLLVLSCYHRLEHIYSEVQRILREVRDNPHRLVQNEPERLLTVVIDGFPLMGESSIQLDFAILVCEQKFAMVQQAITNLSRHGAGVE